MPIFQFTISTENSTKLLNAFCELNNYQVKIPNPTSTRENPLPDIDNPENKTNFIKRMISQWLKQQTRRWEEKLLKDAVITTDIEIT